MKRKIAVYANGWSNEALTQAMKGIKRYARQEDFDVFVFLSHASISSYTDLVRGELNIYRLCDIEDYDGVISFSSMLNSEETAEELCRDAREKHVPVVSIGKEIEGIPSIFVDNETGMRELVTHLVEKQGVKRVVFIGGTPNHEESNIRLQTTRSVLEEHGLTLPEEDVYYAGWTNQRTMAVIHQLLESPKGLPDAIVCANDVMALAASTELARQGYDLMKDVIVTGFDHIEASQIFYPAITSVEPNYEEVGYQSCRLIFDEIRGLPPVGRMMIPSIMVLGENAGNEGTTHYWEKRKAYCQYSYQRSMDVSFMEQTERMMRQRISEAPSYQELKVNLQDHFYRNHQFEGDTLHVIINADYLENMTMDESELDINGIVNRAEAVVAMRDGELLQGTRLGNRDLIPGYEKVPGIQHSYYFLPLHHLQYNYGYVVWANEPYVMRETMLYSYMEKLQQALRLLRTNLRLAELNRDLTRLYDKDPMTGLFNRFGYENKAVPLFEECAREKTPLMVMFVDINFMKRINDRYGHLHGDTAIKTVAESIKENIREDWIAVRFGGDEFLIIAPDCTEREASTVKQRIMEFLEHKNHDGSQPYVISASCGYVITDPAGGESLQDYIREADKLMYEIKNQAHVMDGDT